MKHKAQRPEDFQKFYYAKVGLGEGCGCAERVIDVHEFDRLAGKTKLRLPMLPKKGAWRRFLNKAGLTSRPKA
ncbi:MAG: hypothetical protein AB8B47_00835 [Roseobacter sp.]